MGLVDIVSRKLNSLASSRNLSEISYHNSKDANPCLPLYRLQQTIAWDTYGAQSQMTCWLAAYGARGIYVVLLNSNLGELETCTASWIRIQLKNGGSRNINLEKTTSLLRRCELNR